jgi:hypothetical protein
MKTLRSISKIIVSLFVISLLFSAGCKKDDPGDPPELPPFEALVMDFSDFNDEGDTLSLQKALATYQNWGHSFANVAVWNIIITVTMAVPTAAYLEAFQHTPVYLGDNKWEWKYSVTLDVTYTAVLQTQRIDNETFKAEMYITKSGLLGYQNFKWFEGTVRYDHTHAMWTMYENPANSGAFLQVEWNKDWVALEADITYTIVKMGDPENGSYIKYEIDNSGDYDRAYTISTSPGDINIEWNASTHMGRVMDEVKFGIGSGWQCWNEMLQDTDCLK